MVRRCTPPVRQAGDPLTHPCASPSELPYAAAVASGALTDPTVASFVAGHEAAHVATIKKVLGKAAVKSLMFDFADTVTNQDKFKATAQVLEDTGVSAYAGQGPNYLPEGRGRRGAGNALRRGPPRGLDPLHQRRQPGARDRRQAGGGEGRAEGRHRHRIHQGLSAQRHG
jgi:hypothetical protein